MKEQVPLGHHAHGNFPIKNRQMANVLLSHQPHSFLTRIGNPDCNDWMGGKFGNFRWHDQATLANFMIFG